MPIRLEIPELEKRLDRLAKKQPVPTTKHGMAEAILRVGVEASASDPEAWRRIGESAQPATPSASERISPASDIHEANPHSAQASPQNQGDSVQSTQNEDGEVR